MLAQKVAGINRVNPVKSKYDRAYAASDELNAGNWYLPHPQVAPWVNEFLFELSSFPRGKFDDWVDAWSQAAGELNGGVDYSMFTPQLQVLPGVRHNSARFASVVDGLNGHFSHTFDDFSPAPSSPPLRGSYLGPIAVKRLCPLSYCSSVTDAVLVCSA